MIPTLWVAFGQNGGEFNLFNTDRQRALQTAVNMLRSLNEEVACVRQRRPHDRLDNQAQLRATAQCGVRANVSFFPVDARTRRHGANG
jgi:hypothetical protein